MSCEGRVYEYEYEYEYKVSVAAAEYVNPLPPHSPDLSS
jgi:hypothetical protein